MERTGVVSRWLACACLGLTTENGYADRSCETNYFLFASGATGKDPLIAFVMAESLLRSKRDDHSAHDERIGDLIVGRDVFWACLIFSSWIAIAV